MQHNKSVTELVQIKDLRSLQNTVVSFKCKLSSKVDFKLREYSILGMTRTNAELVWFWPTREQIWWKVNVGEQNI